MTITTKTGLDSNAWVKSHCPLCGQVFQEKPSMVPLLMLEHEKVCAFNRPLTEGEESC